MSFLRRALEFLADGFDRIRDPGWPRTLVILALIALVLLIPYPLSVTGDFEMISTNPVMTRNNVAGRVTEVLVSMNDEVEEGQVVVHLANDEAKHELARIEAELAAATALWRMKKNGSRPEDVSIERFRVQELRAIEQLAKIEFERMHKLRTEDVATQAELDLARSKHLQAQKVLSQGKQRLTRLQNGFQEEEIEQAAADVDALKARRAEVMQRLEWLEVRSPKSGRVVNSNEELRELVGKHVERGTGLVSTIAAGELVAQVRIEESDFGDIELEDEVLLRAYELPSIKFRGKVDSIHPVISNDDEFSTSVTLLTRADDSNWAKLSLNSTGKAKVTLGSRPIGLVLARRVIRSFWVQAWSWY